MKLSDSLVLEARLAGKEEHRSIAGQVEFWAQLGRSIELLLQGRQILALQRSASVRPLSECVASVDSPEGKERVAAWLENQPFPHYQAHPDKPGFLIRIEEDGTRTTGRFIQRRFVPAEASAR